MKVVELDPDIVKSVPDDAFKSTKGSNKINHCSTSY